MNWTALLAALKAKGFAEANPTPENVKAFLASQNIVLKVKGTDTLIDVDATHKAHTATTVEIDPEAVGDLTADDLAAVRKHRRGEVEKVRGKGFPGNPAEEVKVGYSRRHASDADVKSYNRKAAAGRTVFADADQAINFAVWAKSVLAPRLMTNDDCALLAKTMGATTNTAGGALIPNNFVPQLIDLKEERGLFRQTVPVTPMSRDTLTFPRRVGGLTVYFPGEAGSITASDPTVNNVTVTANKMATLTYVPSELLHDAALSVSDFVAREIAYAFADKEDECGFNGDGTSTYGSMTGLRKALTDLSGTIANIAGLVVASGNTFAEFDLATDITALVGRLPTYAKNPAFYMHREVYFNTIVKEMLAQGGATAQEAQNSYGKSPTLLGYPVRFVQTMPRVDANSQVAILFGEPGLGVTFGEVAGSMEIAVDTSVGFTTDTIAVRGIQRVGVAVHSPGNASATAASRIPGPYVGLISAAS